MASKTFNLDFEGYWRDINKAGLPTYSGNYVVYEATFNKDKETVSLHRIIYIGEAANVQSRISNHEKRNEWIKEIGIGKTLCYSTCHVESSYRERAEAALIFKHKPKLNTEYENNFPFDTTTIQTKGQNALLESKFTIYRTV